MSTEVCVLVDVDGRILYGDVDFKKLLENIVSKSIRSVDNFSVSKLSLDL